MENVSSYPWGQWEFNYTPPPHTPPTQHISLNLVEISVGKTMFYFNIWENTEFKTRITTSLSMEELNELKSRCPLFKEIYT